MPEDGSQSFWGEGLVLAFHVLSYLLRVQQQGWGSNTHMKDLGPCRDVPQPRKKCLKESSVVAQANASKGRRWQEPWGGRSIWWDRACEGHAEEALPGWDVVSAEVRARLRLLPASGVCREAALGLEAMPAPSAQPARSCPPDPRCRLLCPCSDTSRTRRSMRCWATARTVVNLDLEGHDHKLKANAAQT